MVVELDLPWSSLAVVRSGCMIPLHAQIVLRADVLPPDSLMVAMLSSCPLVNPSLRIPSRPTNDP